MQTITSKKYSLDWKDLARGLLLAIISAVLTAISTALDSESINFNWKAIALVALSTAVSYLLKNFFTASEIVLKNPPVEDIQAIKMGIAQIAVVGKTETSY